MKIKLILLSVLACNSVVAQIAANRQETFLGFIAAKEFSKTIALYKAKSFVVDEIIGGATSDVVKFEIDPLVASNSGELTTLVYKCNQKNKAGLILGFYGEYWNKAGVIYTGYAFKDLPLVKANELLAKIQLSLDSNANYIDQDYDNNNITFLYDDITIIIYRSQGSQVVTMRLFWNGFDAEWNKGEFTKTVKRLGNKLK